MVDIDRLAVAVFVLMILTASYLVAILAVRGTLLLLSTVGYLVIGSALLYRTLFGGRN